MILHQLADGNGNQFLVQGQPLALRLFLRLQAYHRRRPLLGSQNVHAVFLEPRLLLSLLDVAPHQVV